jgi:ribosomal protein L37E
VINSTYVLLRDATGTLHAIHCNVCGKTSYNINDVKHRYCASCNRYHEQTTAHDGAGVQGA